MNIEYIMPQDFTQKAEGVTYGKLVNISYPSTCVKKERKANVLLPANYSEDKEYPIVYLLHGIGGDEEEWFMAKPVEIMGNLMAKGMIKEMIAVFPNVRVRENDANNPDDIFTKEHFEAFDRFLIDLTENLMPYMESHFSVKKGRENTAIAGYSMGGRETLYISFTRPDLFSYIGAFSPAFGLLPYENNGVREEGLMKDNHFKLPSEYPAYVCVMNGDNDLVVRDEPHKYHVELEKAQTEHLYYEIPGGHDFDVWGSGLYYFTQQIF